MGPVHVHLLRQSTTSVSYEPIQQVKRPMRGQIHSMTQPRTHRETAPNKGTPARALHDHTENHLETHPNNVLRSTIHPQNTGGARWFCRKGSYPVHLTGQKMAGQSMGQPLGQRTTPSFVDERHLDHHQSPNLQPRCTVNHLETHSCTPKTCSKSARPPPSDHRMSEARYHSWRW